MTNEEAIRELLTAQSDIYASRFSGISDEAIMVAVEALRGKPPGHWIKDVDSTRRWDRVRFYCSECNSWQTYGETKYCCNCGCRMEKGEQNVDSI